MKLNMEQRRIVELEPNGHMLVKGVAGSGKTTVSVKRIPYLLTHHCYDSDDKILLLTFNKTLLNYIKYQYKKVEDNDQLQFEMFINKDKEVEINTIDSIMYKYFKRYLKRNSLQLKLLDKTIEFQTLSKSIHEINEIYPNLKTISSKNSMFLMDEISWIKACNIFDLDSYQNIDRIGRTNGGDRTPQKLLKNSKIRKAIFELMLKYDNLLNEQGYVDFKTMNLIALQEAQQNPMDKFKHIIIDESQDLTKTQLEFIKCIYNEKKYSSIMFVADNTQSIYSQSWLGKGRPFTTIGFDMSGKSRLLTKNYRTTTQISAAAYNLIEKDETIKNNLDFVKPSLIDRQGHPPICKYFKDSAAQMRFIVEEINILQNDYKLSNICIVAKERRLLENVIVGLEKANIDCEMLNQTEPDFDSNKVKVVTMHSIKGLEFKVIFLVDLNEGVIPNTKMFDMDDVDSIDSEERKLLYVGMTRANELLYMSSVDKPSKFIKEIDINNLRMKRDCTLRPFHSISIQDYLLTNQIMDVNAREELVRQWMIKELNEIYSYPLELIQLEYPVQQFSKKGYVDIAVNIYFKGKYVPYLFIETKRFGSGVDSAIEQLKSYMSSDQNVRYGIATDGLEVIVINRNEEILYDIPKCQPNFLPETKEKKTYTNFRNNRKFIYSFEKDDPTNIDIVDNDSKLGIEYPNRTNVPLVGDVAAGIPINVNIEYGESLVIPNEWVINPKDTFALRVCGDSMAELINKGDYVIVNKQDNVQNGDIVIAIIGQEATMKKFMLMGDSVLLISENPDYEPIQMKREDVMINGKVIGVLR